MRKGTESSVEISRNCIRPVVRSSAGRSSGAVRLPENAGKAGRPAGTAEGSGVPVGAFRSGRGGFISSGEGKRALKLSPLGATPFRAVEILPRRGIFSDCINGAYCAAFFRLFSARCRKPGSKGEAATSLAFLNVNPVRRTGARRAGCGRGAECFRGKRRVVSDDARKITHERICYR